MQLRSGVHEFPAPDVCSMHGCQAALLKPGPAEIHGKTPIDFSKAGLQSWPSVQVGGSLLRMQQAGSWGDLAETINKSEQSWEGGLKGKCEGEI